MVVVVSIVVQAGYAQKWAIRGLFVGRDLGEPEISWR